jgi:hypothetical protein
VSSKTQQGMFWAAQNTSSSSKRLVLTGNWISSEVGNPFKSAMPFLLF